MGNHVKQPVPPSIFYIWFSPSTNSINDTRVLITQGLLKSASTVLREGLSGSNLSEEEQRKNRVARTVS